MLVVQATKKLLDRLDTASFTLFDTSTTVLGDWVATALFWRPQVALFVNERTFLPVFMPLAPAVTLLDRAPDEIAAMLEQHGVGPEFLTAEREAMREVRVTTTSDRSLIGVMNGLAAHAKQLRDQRGLGLDELSMTMANTPVGPLRDREGFPSRELTSVLGLDRSNVIPFPNQRVAASSSPAHVSVYRMKVTLKGPKPPIWRRILVDGSATLQEVHEVIQAAFGWWNYHLYDFEFGRTRYGIPDPDWDVGPPTGDARTTRLDDVAGAGASFSYTYDFGDYWEHKVIVEKVLDAAPDQRLPACLDGRRAGPPEDSGGPWGYEELLAILADPSHPEHAARVEWVAQAGDGPFDPDRFDADDFEANLRTVRMNAVDH